MTEQSANMMQVEGSLSNQTVGKLTASHKLIPNYLYDQLVRLARDHGRMSYNDSYYGEDAGWLKRLAHELGHWIDHGQEKENNASHLTVHHALTGYVNGLHEQAHYAIEHSLNENGHYATFSYNAESKLWSDFLGGIGIFIMRCDPNDPVLTSLTIPEGFIKQPKTWELSDEYVVLTENDLVLPDSTFSALNNFLMTRADNLRLIEDRKRHIANMPFAQDNFVTTYLTANLESELKDVLEKLTMVRDDHTLFLEYSRQTGIWNLIGTPELNPDTVAIRRTGEKLFSFQTLPNSHPITIDKFNHLKIMLSNVPKHCR